MKLTAVLLLIGALHVSAGAYSQKVTISGKDLTLDHVFDIIKDQTGYAFLYNKSLLKSVKPITIDVRDMPLEEALSRCLVGQPFTYTIEDKIITIAPASPATARGEAASRQNSLVPLDQIVRGRVLDSTGAPLEGATVTVKGTRMIVATDSRGDFTLPGSDQNATLVISSVGYETVSIPLKGREAITVRLKKKVDQLDEMVVQAYGTTTQRLSTGNISTVTSAEIERQPVANPLAALEGRVPGMTVVQSSGLPGASFNVQIRGRTSVNTNISDDPLFIIDGVPFANNNNPISYINSALSYGLSPFTLISPSDIESITVLKDADATSIYGSRGANGVVLITTKKGKAGSTKVDANVYTGFSNVPRTMPVMNTPQYLGMRHEAFANDGVTPTKGNAPDLLVWDTTRNTDWQKYLIGNTASTLDANLSFSGGNNQTHFLVGGGYHRETTVFPGNLSDGRASLHFNINHQSINKKFDLTFSGGFSNDQNHLNVSDLTRYAYLMKPDNPPLYNASGGLNFSENGASFDNPLSYLLQTYAARSDNYMANLVLSYQLAKGLSLKSSFGYNAIYVDEISTDPLASQNPANYPTGSAQFNNSNFKSLIVEPQAEYITVAGPGKLDVLLGSTWQQNTSGGMYFYGADYSSDALLQSIAAAGEIWATSNTSTQYKYGAVFGRMTYNVQDKYLLNISGRRDGSSRFGPGRQFADFGAAGAAWVFSNEQFARRNLSFLSFGKLRGSYGTSGNDKIGDYNYLDSWSSTAQTYLGNTGLYPTQLFNPDYSWEVNKKLEFGLDLGFLQDKILFTASWYQNRSGNELVSYALPEQTGGSSITANFPALVQNTGWEFTVNTTNIKKGGFEWNTTFNMTIPRNKLISFPNIENSSYYSYLLVGKSIDIRSGLKVKGVNPETGVYDILGKDGNVTAMPTNADQILGLYNTDPTFYGGIGNDFRYKGFQLSFFFDYKKQMGQNYLGNLISNWQYPGTAANMPADVLGRWTPENTNTPIEKFTTTTTSPAYKAANSLSLYSNSAFFGDASFARLRNLSIAYNLSDKWLKHVKMKGCKLYINAENLFTITGYKGTDPEVQNIFVLPVLRTFVGGFQITL